MRLPPALPTAAALLFLGTSATAQGPFLYSPKQLAVEEGRYYCNLFGAWPTAHQQLIDGENRGATAQLKALAFRLDHRNHSSRTTAAGRTWSRVTIDLAEGDLATASQVFTRNLLTTPTRVFDGSVTWPDFSGTPLTRPSLWGGIQGGYRVPFRVAWSYSGTQDIVSDWQFTGGRLHNQGNWTPALPSYWLDSYHDPDEPNIGNYRYIPSTRLNNDSPGVTSRCNDSSFGSIRTGAFANLFARAYGPDASQTSWRDKLVIWSASYYTAPGAPVVHGWAFGAHDPGFDLATGCNRLHLFGFSMFFTYAVPPSTTNPSGFVTTPPVVTPWVSALSSLRVVLQAGWADSTTRQLRLTQAHEVVLPPGPPPPIPRRAALFAAPTTPVQGPDRSYRFNPAIRYEQ